MVVLDAMQKCSGVRLVQLELNDGPGVCLKMAGQLANLAAAIDAARVTAGGMGVSVVTDLIPAPSPLAQPAWAAVPDFNPLIEQPTVFDPEKDMTQHNGFALGFIETQGYTAVFEAIDTAIKTAAVEVVAREKLGGGFITVVIKGDVAAVRAAIDAGKAKVDGLGKIIAAHVIPNPSEGVLALLPKG
jgi:microcompartment protein CcmL/EutN